MQETIKEGLVPFEEASTYFIKNISVNSRLGIAKMTNEGVLEVKVTGGLQNCKGRHDGAANAERLNIRKRTVKIVKVAIFIKVRGEKGVVTDDDGFRMNGAKVTVVAILAEDSFFNAAITVLRVGFQNGRKNVLYKKVKDSQVSSRIT